MLRIKNPLTKSFCWNLMTNLYKWAFPTSAQVLRFQAPCIPSTWLKWVDVKIYCLAQTKNLKLFQYFLFFFLTYTYPPMYPPIHPYPILTKHAALFSTCSHKKIKPISVSSAFSFSFNNIFNLHVSFPPPISSQKKKKTFSLGTLLSFRHCANDNFSINLLSFLPDLIIHVRINHHLFEFLKNFECTIIIVTFSLTVL